MTTRQDVARAFRDAMIRVKHDKELPAYMGVYTASGWDYDTADGRKWVRVLVGGAYVQKQCFLVDTTIPDSSTQAVWVAMLREGYWAITRRRFEGY